MYIFLTIACLLSIVHISEFRSVFYFDETVYNPCGSQSGLYFYPHPTDPSKYYQCNEAGTAYLQSCGDLVWDSLRTACNWPSAVVPESPKIGSAESTTSMPWPTTSSFTTTTSWSIITPSQPSTTFSSPTTTTTTQINTITDGSSFSLCKPINPCGEHAECVESPTTIPISSRRFACICSENWFGRLCDKQIEELTTPTAMTMNQNIKKSNPTDTFLIPVNTEKSSKLIFYGLKGGGTISTYNQTGKDFSFSL